MHDVGMTTRLLAWRGVDDPERLDTATVRELGDAIEAVGTSRTARYVLAFRLTTGPRWITRRVEVRVTGFGWSRRLDLERADDGTWSSESALEGDADFPGTGLPGTSLPGPGLADPGAVADALDCDLGLCPLTNVMPIRRLGLGDAPTDETELVMAWVDVPSLEVVRSVQRYTGLAPSDGARRVRYESERRDFRGDLTIDEHGYVIDYPQLARALR